MRYHLNVNIPAGRSGTVKVWHVEYPAGTSLPVASARTRVLAGHSGRDIRYRQPTRWHFLGDHDGVWMSDLPIEQAQMDRALRHMRGRVLVGGLGLGVFASRAARRRYVESVTVVEKNPDVIKLVDPHLSHAKIRVVQADLFEYLCGWPGTFDAAFYDIWRGDGETTFIDTVLPLRALSVGLVDDQRLFCWNEDIMRAQVRNGLASLLMMTALRDGMPEAMAIDEKALRGVTGNPHHDTKVPFWRDTRGLPHDARVLLAATYANVVGRPGWEARWKGHLAAAGR
jgi:hypothetical protein